METYFGEGNNVLTNSISFDIISDPHIASDGKSYTPDAFKGLFTEGNTTLIPHSPITREPFEKINPEAPEYYKKFLRKNFMLSDVLEYIAKKEKKKKTSRYFSENNLVNLWNNQKTTNSQTK